MLGTLYERGPANAADAAEAVAAALGRMHAGAPGAPPSPVGPGAQTYGRVLGGYERGNPVVQDEPASGQDDMSNSRSIRRGGRRRRRARAHARRCTSNICVYI